MKAVSMAELDVQYRQRPNIGTLSVKKKSAKSD